MDDQNDSTVSLSDSVRLPCGRELHNRLVKVAMYEHLAEFSGGPPNPAHFALYSRWAKGNWAMIITGNVAVTPDHLSLGRDIVVPSILNAETIRPFQQLAGIIHGECSEEVSSRSTPRTLAIMQLNHAGRQSSNILGGRLPFVPPMAPSAIALKLKTSRSSSNESSTSIIGSLMHAALFQAPYAMSLDEIDTIVHSFVRGAQLAVQSGFDGIELHASHGYLISQFMSPKSNSRTDAYSAHSHPVHFLHRIVLSIRASGVVPVDFVLGVKLNAADYADTNADTGNGAFDASRFQSDEERVLSHLQQVASWGMVDFIEVSGGDYENPDFLTTKSHSRRQALFAKFSQRAMQLLQHEETNAPDSLAGRGRPLILLTGGLNSPELLSSALAQKHADILGVGRLSVLCPELPRLLAETLENKTSSTTISLAQLSIRQPMSFGARLEKALISNITYLWSQTPTYMKPELPKLIGAGTEMAWYIVMMRALATGQEQTYYPGDALGAIIRMWIYVAPDSEQAERSSRTYVMYVVMVVAVIAVWLSVGPQLP